MMFDTYALCWNNVFQCRTMIFCLWLVPLVFTKVVKAAMSHLHFSANQIHSCLDDFLLTINSSILLKTETCYMVDFPLILIGFSKFTQDARDGFILWLHLSGRTLYYRFWLCPSPKKRSLCSFVSKYNKYLSPHHLLHL